MKQLKPIISKRLVITFFGVAMKHPTRWQMFGHCNSPILFVTQSKFWKLWQNNSNSLQTVCCSPKNLETFLNRAKVLPGGRGGGCCGHGVDYDQHSVGDLSSSSTPNKGKLSVVLKTAEKAIFHAQDFALLGTYSTSKSVL
jgi:hypothetical protein